MLKPLSLNTKITAIIIILMMTIISASTNKAHGQQILEKMDKELVDRYKKLMINVYDPQTTAAVDSFFEESVNNDDWHQLYLAYRLKSYSLLGLNKFKESIEMSRMAASIADEHGEDEAFYDSGDMIIVALISAQKSYQALKEAQEFAKKAVNDKCKYGIIMTNIFLGKIFSIRGDPRMAIYHLEKELDTMKKLGMQRQIYVTYIYLGQCYRELLKNDKAKECLKLASEYAYDTVSKYNAEFTSLLYLFEIIPPQEFHKRYKEVSSNALYTSLVDQETQKLLTIMDLISCDKGEEALALCNTLFAPNNATHLRICALKQLKRYKEAIEIMDTFTVYNDSVKSKLQLEDLAEIQASFNDTKLEMEAERKAMHDRIIIMALVITLLLVTTLSFAHITRRRKKYIKDMRQKNEELIAAHKQTEKALEMKTSFIHNMSHEIRTPLNQISGFSQMLATENLDEEEKDNVRKIIVNQTDHLVKMLNTIIEFSDLETKVENPEMETVQLKPFLQGLTYLIPTPQEGVTLSVGGKTDPTLSVTTNANSLRRIVLCLADNAVKFTSKGSISINATLNDKGQTIIVVEDTGRGINPENATKVFERFFKEDDFVPGTGLGLPLARMHADYISASLTLDTTVETGSRFVLAFPQREHRA